MFIYQRVLYLDVIQVGKLWLVTVAYGMTQLFDKPYLSQGFSVVFISTYWLGCMSTCAMLKFHGLHIQSYPE